MDMLHRRCAGLDVHKDSVVACARWLDERDRVRKEVKTFGTTTPALLELLAWLEGHHVTHVAMESTGVYWKPVFNIVEGHATVILVNAEHIKQVPGRKTDVKDCEWIAQLLQHGLLRASFVPERPIRDLRDLTRQRTQVTREKVGVANRIQKVLEDANIKLGSVASDVLGASGRDMLQALVDGVDAAGVLANLARGRLRDKLPQLRQALTGRVTDHHRFLLRLHLDHLGHLEELIRRLDGRIHDLLTRDQPPESAPTALLPAATAGAAVPPAPPAGSGPATRGLGIALGQPAPPAHAADTALLAPPKERGAATTSGTTASATPVQGPLPLWLALGLLTSIPGINRRTAEVVLAELGTDMGRFPTNAHLASWTGLCPGNHESAGKRKSGKTTHGNVWLRAALVQAAWAASHTKRTYLASQYQRLARRRGKKKALIAVAHTLLTIIYQVLKKGETYQELGADYFDHLHPEILTKQLVKRLEKLGHKVTLVPQEDVA